MKKNIRKRALALVLAAVMALSATACGGGSGSASNEGASGTGGSAVSAVIDKNLIFKERAIDLSAVPFDLGGTGEAVFVGDRLYMTGYEYDQEKYASTMFVVSMDKEGKDVKSYVLGDVSDGSFDYSRPAFDDEGNAYAVKMDYGKIPDYILEQMNPSEGTGGESSEGGASEAVGNVTAGETVTAGDTAATETSVGGETTGGTGATENPTEKSTAGEETTGEEAGATSAEAITDAPPTGEEGSEDDVEVEPDDGEWSDQDTKYYLVKFDNEGKVLFETELNKSDFVEEDGYFGIYNTRYIKDAGVLLQLETGLFLCSAEDGTFIRQVYKKEQDDYVEYCFSGNGKVYMISYGGDLSLVELDLETGKTGESITIPDAVRANGFGSGMLQAGSGSDFIMQDRDGISEWNIGDDKIKKVLSFTDSDIAVDNINGIVKLSDTLLFINYASQTPEGEYTTVSAFLDKVNPEDVVDKKVLTVGINYMDTKLRNIIVAFNKVNEKYKVKVIDYSQYNTEGDWMAGSNKFNADLVSGNGPDMMYLDMSQSLQALQSKGVFEPLDDYLANDPDLSKKEFMTKVLDAYKYKGTTYMLVPSFSAFTYAMKKSDADKLSEWNLKTLDKMIQDRGLDYATVFGYPLNNSQFLQMSLIFDASSFMDWNTDKASFNSPQFIELLNFCKKIPESVDELYSDAAWETFETAFRDGKALVSQTSIYRFRDYAQLRYATFGEEVSFVGFPRMEGAGGAAVSADYLIGMNSHASDKDACWEFMRTFYTDDFQNSIVKEGWQLPIARAQMEELAKMSMERPYHMVDGEKQEYDETFYMNGQEIKIPPLTQEEVDQLFAYFDNIDTAVSYDQKVFAIIAEEAAPFFKGQKTAEECAQIIQSKVQLYMDENS